MISRRATSIREVLAAALTCASLSSCAPVPDPPRNVVVILVDALRPDRLGVYGHSGMTSPSIDRLAERAYVYENAYSTSTWTVPAVASLFTGTLPVVHRIDRPPYEPHAFAVLDDAFLLAPEVFRENGFATGMITTIGWVSDLAGYGQGVDEFLWTDRSDAALVSSAREFITRHREGRFHLYLHLIDLHDYYDPDLLFADVDLDRIDPASGLLDLGGRSRKESFDYLKAQSGPEASLTDRDVEWLLDVYDRELRKTDALIGELAGHLREEGLLEETVIVITADHGEQFMEHGRLLHGTDGFYNEVLKIPLILSMPGGLEAPRRIRAPVSLIDLYPTVFELLGIPAAEPFQGTSVLDGAERDRAAYATDGSVWKVITQDHGYIARGGGREEIYDLVADPAEKRNLAGEEAVAPVLAEMRRRLQAMREASARHAYHGMVGTPGTEEMTEEQLETLRSLGYVE